MSQLKNKPKIDTNIRHGKQDLKEILKKLIREEFIVLIKNK